MKGFLATFSCFLLALGTHGAPQLSSSFSSSFSLPKIGMKVLDKEASIAKNGIGLVGGAMQTGNDAMTNSALLGMNLAENGLLGMADHLGAGVSGGMNIANSLMDSTADLAEAFLPSFVTNGIKMGTSIGKAGTNMVEGLTGAGVDVFKNFEKTKIGMMKDGTKTMSNFFSNLIGQGTQTGMGATDKLFDVKKAIVNPFLQIPGKLGATMAAAASGNLGLSSGLGGGLRLPSFSASGLNNMLSSMNLPSGSGRFDMSGMSNLFSGMKLPSGLGGLDMSGLNKILSGMNLPSGSGGLDMSSLNKMLSGMNLPSGLGGLDMSGLNKMLSNLPSGGLDMSTLNNMLSKMDLSGLSGLDMSTLLNKINSGKLDMPTLNNMLSKMGLSDLSGLDMSTLLNKINSGQLDMPTLNNMLSKMGLSGLSGLDMSTLLNKINSGQLDMSALTNMLGNMGTDASGLNKMLASMGGMNLPGMSGMGGFGALPFGLPNLSLTGALQTPGINLDTGISGLGFSIPGMNIDMGNRESMQANLLNSIMSGLQSSTQNSLSNEGSDTESNAETDSSDDGAVDMGGSGSMDGGAAAGGSADGAMGGSVSGSMGGSASFGMK